MMITCCSYNLVSMENDRCGILHVHVVGKGARKRPPALSGHANQCVYKLNLNHSPSSDLIIVLVTNAIII